jgi:hypothetical protein
MDIPLFSGSWLALIPYLNEVQLRLYAAGKAIELGRGGIERVHEATGLDPETIRKGIRELSAPESMPDPERIRHQGGGRKKVEEIDPAVIGALESLLEGDTAGLPTGPLRWTHKSVRRIATEMTKLGHRINPNTASRLLDEHHYSRQVNSKTKGHTHIDRDRQFRHISRTVSAFMRTGDPVISVDAKKREKIGEFRNPGRTWRKTKSPRRVNTYDFAHLAVGIAIPHGTYDPKMNDGFVNVGITHETNEFAVHSIGEWWRLRGRRHYPKARRLLICADAGGSNGYKNRGWKLHLQSFATALRIPISVSHYPPGTSKWNKIEHRMFSQISINWQGTPLESYQTIINLIGNTHTETGLTIKAQVDRNEYEVGIEFTDEEMAGIHLLQRGLHPEWNYTIAPARPKAHGK